MNKEECEKALLELRKLERADNFKKWGGQVAPQVQCDAIEKLINEHFKLEKTLNNACKLLNDITGTCPFDKLDFDIDCENRCNREEATQIDCWKRWCMENDQSN